MEEGVVLHYTLDIVCDPFFQVTDAVHHDDSFNYAQLWAMGRGAEPTELQKEGFEYIGVSDIALQQDGSGYFGLSNIPLAEKPKPRALTTSGMIPLTKYDRSTFYTFETAEGYTDYPFSF